MLIGCEDWDYDSHIIGCEDWDYDSTCDCDNLLFSMEGRHNCGSILHAQQILPVHAPWFSLPYQTNVAN